MWYAKEVWKGGGEGKGSSHSVTKKQQVTQEIRSNKSDADEPPATKEMRDVINYCYKATHHCVQCQCTSHSIGSTNTNPSGIFMEYFVIYNLNILNYGNEPIFVVCNRKQVIDLTLGPDKNSNLVNNRHVSDERTSSDHRNISFQIGNIILE
jgi:hypothetical protein